MFMEERMIGIRNTCFFLLGMVMIAACASKSPYEQGRYFHDAGRYAEAIEYYTQAVNNPVIDRELFRSNHFRGEANRVTGFIEKAFYDFYAAMIVSCYLEKRETHTGAYAYGMIPSTYCRIWGKQKLMSLSSDISQEQQAALKQQAETALSRFLK
jgi:hypothetical protein